MTCKLYQSRVFLPSWPNGLVEDKSTEVEPKQFYYFFNLSKICYQFENCFMAKITKGAKSRAKCHLFLCTLQTRAIVSILVRKYIDWSDPHQDVTSIRGQYFLSWWLVLIYVTRASRIQEIFFRKKTRNSTLYSL